MRDTLKESLMKQWELESARKEQMGALAHDLKTPLTVIRGNVQLMGEAESLEEDTKVQPCIGTGNSGNRRIFADFAGDDLHRRLSDVQKRAGGHTRTDRTIQRADRSGGCREEANDSV